MKKLLGAGKFTVFPLLIFAAVVTFFLNVVLGSVNIHPAEVVKIIRDEMASIMLPDYRFEGGAHYDIVWKIRLPRGLAAMIGGASLAVAGLLLQIFFRNPVVGPFVLGISSGATFFVGLVVLGQVAVGIRATTPFVLFVAAFGGAFIVMLVVLAAARRLKSVISLLVIGLMVGYICGAATDFMIAFAQKKEIHNFIIWTLGSFSGFTWSEVAVLTLITVPAVLAAFVMCKPLNALLLGENYASSMGVNIKRARTLIVFISSMLGAVVTGFAGPVAFIGLAVPHIARLLLGTSDTRVLVPACVLVGAIITGLCDLLSRLLFAPVELPISAVTSFVGAPVIISLLVRRKNVL